MCMDAGMAMCMHGHVYGQAVLAHPHAGNARLNAGEAIILEHEDDVLGPTLLAANATRDQHYLGHNTAQGQHYSGLPLLRVDNTSGLTLLGTNAT